MAIGLPRRGRLRDNRLRKKGVTVQEERILRAFMHLARVRDSSERAHAYRIRTIKRLCDLLEGFLAEEIRRATSLPKGDDARVSWQQVANALEVSKTTAWNRYGASEKANTKRTP